jgi:hypothetical protein
MGYSLLTQPLTLVDIKTIKAIYRRITIVLIIMLVLFSGISVGIFIWMDTIMPFIIFGLFDAGVIFGLFYIQGLTHKELNRGTKSVLTGTLTQKLEKARTNIGGTNTRRNTDTQIDFYFVFDDFEIPVNLIEYNKYHAGQQLEIAFSNATRIILSIKLLDDVTHTEHQAHGGKTETESPFLIEMQTGTMNEDELVYITHLRNRRLIYTTLWSLSLGFISYWILMIMLAVLLTSFNANTIIRILGPAHYIVVALIIAVIAWVYLKRVIPLVRDCNSGQKRIIPVEITDKIHSEIRHRSKNVRITSSRGDFYYIFGNDQMYLVSSKAFESFEINEPVKIHSALYSKKLLLIEGKKEKVSMISSPIK